MSNVYIWFNEDYKYSYKDIAISNYTYTYRSNCLCIEKVKEIKQDKEYTYVVYKYNTGKEKEVFLTESIKKIIVN